MSQAPVEPTETPAAAATTGHPLVDDVLASLEALEGRPLAEHVTVFEDAHDRLRGALADAAEPGTAPA